MKKNSVMRLLSLVLVLTLISTCAISGTFAKYTTQDSAGDAARVAKWGVALQAAGSLYGDHYGTGTVAPTAYGTSATPTVSAGSSGTNVVAPGTIGDTGLAFSIDGTPEVSGLITAVIKYENIYLKGDQSYGVMIPVTVGEVEFKKLNDTSAGAAADKKLYTEASGTYSPAGSTFDSTAQYYTLEDYVTIPATDAFYYPVEYQMTGTDTNYNVNYLTYDTKVDELAGIATAIAEKIQATPGTPSFNAGEYTYTLSTGTEFAPNTNLSSVIKLGDQNITWKWDFEQDSAYDSKVGDEASWQSKADTILGNLSGMIASDGVVVKASGTTFVAPVAAAGDTASTGVNDYNLETSFSIDITVTQVD